MPSPTMATTGAGRRAATWAAWSWRMAAAFSPGSTSASTRSIPTWPAVHSAARRLSPVIITRSMPSRRRSATASAEPGLRVSATAMTPTASAGPSPSAAATTMAVLP